VGNRLAGRASSGNGEARVLMLVSHVHADHTMGFPFFKPVYQKGSRLFIQGPSYGTREFQEVFEAAFADPFFPVSPANMASHRIYRTLTHGDVLCWRDPHEEPHPLLRGRSAGEGLVVRVFRNLQHPNGGVLNFRLERGGKSVVLATDVEGTNGVDGDLVEFARGADLLIHDAQYTDEEYETFTQGWGHSTWRMAADVAWRAQARRLVLFHHEPAHDDRAIEDIERRTRGKFPRCVAACEGMEILV
jgi:phosphoribosyl 1,2-cyclic phosphodiesterase